MNDQQFARLASLLMRLMFSGWLCWHFVPPVWGAYEFTVLFIGDRVIESTSQSSVQDSSKNP